MGTVMQQRTHKTLAAPRFFINGRGVLMDRQGTGSARRTGYSMAHNCATRTEMQILADLMNEPGRGEALDVGVFPLEEWTIRAEQHYCAIRRASVALVEDYCAA